MARINTNVGAVVAQRHLNAGYRALNSTLQRLSSGLRITRGADDPAGLIVSERLRSEVRAVSQAIENTQRASNIIATAEGALNEVAALLNDIQDLIVEAANRGALSDDEIAANQLQVDSAIESITRIANSTTFAGRKLLDGSLDYVTSGVNPNVVTTLQVLGAQFGSRSFIPVNVNVLQSAQPAALYFANSSLTQPVVVEIKGNIGAASIGWPSGTAASAIVDSVNTISDSTGVVARFINTSNQASGVVLESQLLGSRQFASVVPLSGNLNFSFTETAGANDFIKRDEGRDATGLINGAATIGDGNDLALRSSTLSLDLSLATNFGLGTTSFAITEGGALFQVGPQVTSTLQVNLGIPSVAASRLGNAVIGFLTQIKSDGPHALTKNGSAQAQKIVSEALKQVSVLRGRLGAFEKNTLDTNVNQLGITMENLMAAESNIRDADFAFETSKLARDQILIQAGTSVLAIANQTPQTVLRLLG